MDTQGRNVGEARLQETPHGVLLKLELRNATPGVRALPILRLETPPLAHPCGMIHAA